MKYSLEDSTMKTLYLSAQDPKTAATAANIIMGGGLVAIPTETV